MSFVADACLQDLDEKQEIEQKGKGRGEEEVGGKKSLREEALSFVASNRWVIPPASERETRLT